MNLSTLAGNEQRFQTCSTAKHFFAKALTALFFLVLVIQFNANGQAPPSCNLSGTLQTKVKGANIIVNVEVANSSANPGLSYSLQHNSSGAAIVTKSRPVYTAKTNSITQEITIAPGTAVGGFNLQLVATTPGGSCKCSKSISVTN